jgi:hypothetical protein
MLGGHVNSAVMQDIRVLTPTAGIPRILRERQVPRPVTILNVCNYTYSTLRHRDSKIIERG